jgi:hypothetical protein
MSHSRRAGGWGRDIPGTPLASDKVALPPLEPAEAPDYPHFGNLSKTVFDCNDSIEVSAIASGYE